MTSGHILSTVAQNGHDQTQLVSLNFEKQKANGTARKTYTQTDKQRKTQIRKSEKTGKTEMYIVRVKEEPTLPEVVDKLQRSLTPNIKEEPSVQEDRNVFLARYLTPEPKREILALPGPRRNQFICSTCGKSCMSQCHLDKHVLAHSLTVAPFCCYKCGSVFSQKSSLTCHWRNCFP